MFFFQNTVLSTMKPAAARKNTPCVSHRLDALYWQCIASLLLYFIFVILFISRSFHIRVRNLSRLHYGYCFI